MDKPLAAALQAHQLPMARFPRVDPPVLRKNRVPRQCDHGAAIQKDVSGNMDSFTASCVVSTNVSLCSCVVELPVSFGSRAARRPHD
jgi:hypothetical protein